MDLQPSLDRIRQDFEKQSPPEVLAVMHRATDDLRKSGINDRVLKVGQSAPPFELEDSRGSYVGLGDLLQGGPLVMTFFRGNW